MLFLILYCLTFISVNCINDDSFHVGEGPTKLLTLDPEGNLEVIGNVSTVGYCNCLIPPQNIPSMSYPKQNYLPVITNVNGDVWTEYTKQVGRYVVIGNYVNLQVFLTWGNNIPFTDTSLPLLITLPIRPDEINYYSGTVSYTDGLSFSYELGVMTDNGHLTFYDIQGGSSSNPIALSSLSPNGDIILNISYFI